MIDFLFLALSGFYSLIIGYFYVGIRREQHRQTSPGDWQPLVTVLVPARNEAERIPATLASLAAQDYPRELLEVLIIDDQSTDGTAAVVADFIARENLEHFRCLQHRNDGLRPAPTGGRRPTFKKNAITYALQFARGEIIMTIDADCQAQPRWISSMVGRYDSQTGMVAGLVSYAAEDPQSLFQRLQALEFTGLVFAGVGAVGNNRPLICNGSNLSYRRAAFDEVGGFFGHEHLPSGDDDLLMQNLHVRTAWRVRYNLDPAAINRTRPVESLKEFFQQRARWASKSTAYPSSLTMAGLFLLYGYNLLLVLLIPAILWGWISAAAALTGIALKLIPDFAVMRRALVITGQRRLLRLFLAGEVAQPLYIVPAGFAGFFGLFRWKSRP